MLSLDRMLRRVRADINDVQCFYYNQTKREQGGLTAHGDPTKLWFAERDDDIVSKLNITDDDYHTVRGLVAELTKMQALHDMFFKSKPANLQSFIPLDHHIKYVHAGGRRYPVYLCGGAKCFEPANMTEVTRLAHDLVQVIDQVHKAGYLIWNITPKLLYRRADAKGLAMLGPAVTLFMNKAHFPATDPKTGAAPSIIIGSSIPSPYQVLMDMLSSKYEKDEIEYDEFKLRFLHFWGRVLPPEYRHVPDVCQLYHSMKNGSTQFIDTMICKWCRITSDPKTKKHLVAKDPSSLLKPGLLPSIDWFAFAITIDAMIEMVMDKDTNAAPAQSVVDMIQKGIYGEHP